MTDKTALDIVQEGYCKLSYLALRDAVKAALDTGDYEAVMFIEANKPAPLLAGRAAHCDCGKVVPSAEGLPFFEYRPNLPWDRYYCGCRGWE